MKIRLGTDFKKYLKDNFITVNTLADELDLSRQGLHKIVSGKTKRPYNSTLKKIADHLNLKLGSDENGIFFETSNGKSRAINGSSVDRSVEILSNKIAVLITERELSIKEIARQISKPEKIVKQYTAPGNPEVPDIPTLKKLAQIFEVSVDYLISDERSELKERILKNLVNILEHDNGPAALQFKRRLPQNPEARDLKLRRLLDTVELVSPEGLDFFEFLVSMECMLIEDESVKMHIQQLTDNYLNIKKLKNLWQIHNYKRLSIITAASSSVDTGEYIRPSTGIGQVRALALLSESLAKSYGHLNVKNIYLSTESIQERLENDLILLGGPKNNALTDSFLKAIDDQQPATQVGSAIHWRKKEKGGWADNALYHGNVQNKQVRDDFGLIIRAKSPFSSRRRTVVLLSGSHTYGVIAAAKYFTESLINEFDHEILEDYNLSILLKAKVLDQYPVSIDLLKWYKW